MCDSSIQCRDCKNSNSDMPRTVDQFLRDHGALLPAERFKKPKFESSGKHSAGQFNISPASFIFSCPSHFCLTKQLLRALIATVHTRGPAHIVKIKFMVDYVTTVNYSTFKDGPERRKCTPFDLYAQTQWIPRRGHRLHVRLRAPKNMQCRASARWKAEPRIDAEPTEIILELLSSAQCATDALGVLEFK
ncbi:hypothetical protein C8R44DRAFT_751051 [Mycena epipterygia]|nr:hypothetical protein C8R44DRAFT_751051 [Mycena epipterygia]